VITQIVVHFEQQVYTRCGEITLHRLTLF